VVRVEIVLSATHQTHLTDSCKHTLTDRDSKASEKRVVLSINKQETSDNTAHFQTPHSPDLTLG